MQTTNGKQTKASMKPETYQWALAYHREWKKRHRVYLREYQNKYYKNHPGLHTKNGIKRRERHGDHVKAYQKEYHARPEVRTKRYEHERIKMADNPQIGKARYVAKKLKLATAEKCELCPENEENKSFLVRHHPDYFEPRIYITVCPSCHKHIHSDLKTAKTM